MAESRVGKVVDLRAVRAAHSDLRSAARERFAAARRATGLTAVVFADALTNMLGWPVTVEAVSAWESSDVPPGDVLLAADLVSGYPAAITAAPARGGMQVVDTYTDLQAALADVVEGAEDVLAVTGSRSRDPRYLGLIEDAVTGRDLTHYRVLYGPLRHGSLKNHLLRLFDLHRPGKVNLGAFWDLHIDGERFICASERSVVLILPSVNSLLNFDTGLAIDDPALARAYVDHVRQAFLASEALDDRRMIETLEVLR